MLKELKIHNFAIIDSVHLLPSAGLNVLTGETGAGKSIIIDALSLLLGGRASTDLIRSGCDEALVEAAFSLPENARSFAALQEMGLIREGEREVIIRRILSTTGRHRIYLNGSLVALPILEMVGEEMVDIHGQNEHQSLLRVDTQRDILDAYGGLQSLRRNYEESFRRYQHIENQLSTLEEMEKEKVQREEYLVFQKNEIDMAHLREGEEEDLERERRVLTHSEKLSQISATAHQILYSEDDSVLSRLGKIASLLEEGRHLDERLLPVSDLLLSSVDQLKEVAEALRDYQGSLEHDPHRLSEVSDRLHLIARLKKKYGATLTDVLSHLQKVTADLEVLTKSEEKIEALEKERETERSTAFSLAESLHQERTRISILLKKKVNKELSHLRMEGAHFSVAMEPFPSPQLSGKDGIEFLISTNPGEDLKPLKKVASGGEISRMMLALKAVLAEADGVPTLIFDELESGVGGAVVEVIGRKLKSLSRSHQIFCITHLPQIAGLADCHIAVVKDTLSGRAVTRIKELRGQERVEEIARMLGGERITPAVVRHAKEMLAKKYPV